jgi:diguanylate cyclase
MRLLLVDDDEVDRNMVVRLLRGTSLPLDIVQASTAQHGLELSEASTFDVAVLDYLLPDMTGFDVLCLLLREPTNRMAVIILTGATDEALEFRCLAAGAQEFLQKKDITARHLQRALLRAEIRHELETKLLESRESFRALAENDQLTELPNRYFFDKSLRLAVARTQRTGSKLALLLLDLDNFKGVNDTLGHDIGDRLLHTVAARLLSIMRGGDIVCRLGGDEFAIIASDLDTDVSAVKLVQRAQNALQASFRIGDRDVTISASIGIAVVAGSGVTAEQLLKSADLAMYQAKRDGRNRFHFFSMALQVEATRRATIEIEMRSADLFDQLQLFYQPLLDASSLQIRGAEALIRWNHPTRGVLAPGEFFDVAEEVGLMGRIDAWSRRSACQQMSQWLAQELVSEHFVMTFNVCATTLKEDDLFAAIRHDIDEAGLLEGAMELEVTESVLVTNLQRSGALLKRISDSGVGITVDDFGTGYSSLAYLKHFPASTLKIDRSFLFGVPESAADCRILRAVIVMAKSLDLRVTIEGVETEAQARLCREYGADIFQGYYFSRPLPVQSFEAAFKAWH